ncbi:MAG: hypothetical protein CVT48_03855 [Thermoplasmata archaeon HGW-Thermoplasmata-1]|nr:MAG: hypothetical protein CVT48_03855 [Thermoplasmata archaeon HGW-Thermoplasmata-1]
MLSPAGENPTMQALFSKIAQDAKAAGNEFAEKNICCAIGGFPSWDFHSNVYGLCGTKVSIYSEMLTVWTVASEILVNYENSVL